MKRFGVGIRGLIGRPWTAIRVPVTANPALLPHRAAPAVPTLSRKLPILVPLVAIALVILLASACGDSAGSPVTLPGEAAASDGLTPQASPSGDRIAFVSLRNGQAEIHVISADGFGLSNLSNTAQPGSSYPSWSPDGARIAFASTRGGSAEIYVMDADGSAQAPVTSSQAFDGFPAWSPDGSRIAFVSGRDGNSEIYVMNADGSESTRLTDHPASDGLPAWSPDGSRIAFESARDGNFEIYTMNVDGSGLTRLTDNAAVDFAPAWSPSPRTGRVTATYTSSTPTAPVSLASPANSTKKGSPRGRPMDPRSRSTPIATATARST